MMRLDHNRATSLLAHKLNVDVADIDGPAVWGNHSGDQFPDLTNLRISGRDATDRVDRGWYLTEFIPRVANRGEEIINVRGASSAASAASAAVDHMRDWVYGTHGRWTTVALPSTGEYGVDKGLVFGFPVTGKDGTFNVVEGVDLSDFQREHIKLNIDALREEAALADGLV